MKKIAITLFLMIISLTTQAQEGLTWHTDLSKAIEISRQEQKPLFLFFTGSDWCGWCMRLQNEVFKTPEFISWAKEHAVLVELDYPRRTPQTDAIKAQNSQMQQMFQVQGYPTVWFVKPTVKEGKTNFEQLGSTGYVAGGPSKWIEGANEIVSRYVAEPKAEAPAKVAPKAKAKPKKAKKS
ncbi:thioredoxin family protein [Flavobacterium sp. SUN046]|uniref:thioredoxin family protein n=1 Tax=Flavobacterium sp. SUN046 TaxID=3002440 RepID=UPI002DBABF4C|nr:thioredoxin family protein [Flavobacterium sp. SUN046]MEC4049212.1 thioredoxin family protein [Flavobacterium sp. SUN046]